LFAQSATACPEPPPWLALQPDPRDRIADQWRGLTDVEADHRVTGTAARLQRGTMADPNGEQGRSRYDQARDQIGSAAIPQSEKKRLLALIDQFEVQQRALDDSLATILDGIS
jgi:hypothetical protein